MKKFTIAISVLFAVLLCSFSNRDSSFKEKPDEYNIAFVAFDRNSNRKIEGVKLIVINDDGEVTYILTTDKNGKAEKKITSTLDKRYYCRDKNTSIKRGTVTAIAYKKGYCETVILEIPISSAGGYQPFPMYPVVAEQRNEPYVQMGDSHHLEIVSLVEKYRQYANGK